MKNNYYPPPATKKSEMLFVDKKVEKLLEEILELENEIKTLKIQNQNLQSEISFLKNSVSRL